MNNTEIDKFQEELKTIDKNSIVYNSKKRKLLANMVNYARKEIKERNLLAAEPNQGWRMIYRNDFAITLEFEYNNPLHRFMSELFCGFSSSDIEIPLHRYFTLYRKEGFYEITLDGLYLNLLEFKEFCEEFKMKVDMEQNSRHRDHLAEVIQMIYWFARLNSG
jgi:hypothetical protein